MSEESNAHLIEQLEKLGAAVRPWTSDDFICFAIVAREGLPTILASLRRSAPASGEMGAIPLWANWIPASAMTDADIDTQFKLIDARRNELRTEMNSRALRTPSGETGEEAGS